MKKIIIASTVAILTCNAYAKNIPPKKMPLGPVHGSNGFVFSKGKLTTSVKSIFFTKDDRYDGSDKIQDPSNKKMTVAKYNTIIRYGLGSRLDVRMIVPIVNKSMSMFNQKASSAGNFENSGLGDIRALVRYQLTSPALGNHFFSAIGIGAELPTGSTDKRFYLDNGKMLADNQPDGMQNGDGSFDPIIEFGLTKPLPNSRIDFSANYVFNQSGENNFKKGDQFTYNIGYSYKLHERFMPSIELNGTIKDKNIKNDQKINTTGGHELFITPGFSSNITKKLKLFAGVGIPIYRDLNTGALGAETRITTKICYLW